MNEVSHKDEVSHSNGGPYPKYKAGQVFKWAKWVVIIEEVRISSAKLKFSDGYCQWFHFDTMDAKLEKLTIKDKLELL